jgi:hypothetical protein
VFATKACEAMGVGSRDRPHTLWGEGRSVQTRTRTAHMCRYLVCACAGLHIVLPHFNLVEVASPSLPQLVLTGCGSLVSRRHSSAERKGPV